MNCRSCQAQLSARDTKCPSCGRRSHGGRDLGSAALSDSAGSSGSPLPPARSSKAKKAPPAKKAPEPKKTPDVAKLAKPPSPEPALRLTELVRPHSDPASTSSGASASSSPGRAEVLDMIAERPALIESGLRVHVEDGDQQCVSYGTPVGEIDLLARDSGSAWVVVLIPEESREKELVGELLQLMGWVRKHLCEAGQEVRAIALLDWDPEDLGYAAAAVADSVDFKRYKLALTFEPLDV
jgi:hypothetical protein